MTFSGGATGTFGCGFGLSGYILGRGLTGSGVSIFFGTGFGLTIKGGGSFLGGGGGGGTQWGPSSLSTGTYAMISCLDIL